YDATLDKTIYMYYGNGSTGAQERPAKVFDSTNGYVDVLHGDSTTDATGNNTAYTTAYNFTTATGAIGLAGNYNGTSTYIRTAANASLNITTYTESVWIRPSVDGDYWTGVIGKAGRDYNIWIGGSDSSSGFIHHRFHDGAGTNTGAPDAYGVTINGSTWSYITITNDGTTAKTYINGTLIQQGPVTAPLYSDNTALNIGRNLDDAASNYYFGLIDEARVSSVDRSSGGYTGWVATEYNNQHPNNQGVGPGKFIASKGTEEGTPAAVAGNITIANGTLSKSAGTGLALSGASKYIYGTGTTGTISAPIILSGASRTASISVSNTLTISGVISQLNGSYGLTKADAGTLTLSGASTYTGLTTISAGILKLGAAGGATNTPLGTIAAGTVVSATGAALDLGGYTLGTAEPLTLNGTGVSTGGALMNSGAAATYSGLITLGSASSIVGGTGTIAVSNVGTITGATFGLTLGGAQGGTLTSILGTTSGTLTKQDAGTWTVSGNSTYTGQTNITGGILKLGAAGSAGNGPLGTIAGITSVSSTGALDLNGFTLANLEPLTLNGTGASSAGALQNSSGTAATYSGLITLGGASSIIANSGNIILSNAGTITGSGFGLTLGGSNTASSLASIIGTVAGTLTKQGTGTWTVSGASTYTGLTTISAGILKLGAAGGATNTPLGTIAAGTVVSATGAALDLGGYTLGTAEPLTLNGTGLSTGGALMNSGAAATYSGLITLGSASSIVGGTGTIAVSNVGTITGATFGLTLGGAQGGTLTSILG
ncbi:MAG: autotransporter-associated beta strand repeat-containing protein, partial [Dehalococcoidales bacterium]|nr:autotransporter-associated beta strand repeat-containing protein [Dehalococcoidales bacterium]